MTAGIELSLPAVAAVVSGLFLFCIAWIEWPFNKYPGYLPWTILLVSSGGYAFSYGIALTAFDLTLRRALEIPVWFFRFTIMVAAFIFALQYTGRQKYVRSKATYAIVFLCGIGIILAATNPVHHLFWINYQLAPVFGSAAVTFSPRLWYVWFGFGIFILLLVIFMLVDTMREADNLYTRELLALVASFVLSIIAHVPTVFDVGPTGGLDLVSFAIAPVGVLVTYALFEGDLFDTVPTTQIRSKQVILDDLATANITVTPDGTVVDFNNRAAEILDVEPSGLVKRDITGIIDITTPLIQQSQTISNPFGEQSVYKLTVSEVTGETNNSTVGYVLSLQDITSERLQQERLSVLTRILRHNLRNELNVIKLQAQNVRLTTENGTDPDRITDSVKTITKTTEKLTQIANKAHTVEQTIFSDSTSHRSINLRGACFEIVEQMRTRFPDAQIILSADRSVYVAGEKGVLQIVIENLVENAIIHSEAQNVEVLMSIGVKSQMEDPPTASIRISDNGPGILEQELTVINQREETSLEHGSGIGLWAVTWGVQILNGQIRYNITDNGTTVVVEIPISEETRMPSVEQTG